MLLLKSLLLLVCVFGVVARTVFVVYNDGIHIDSVHVCVDAVVVVIVNVCVDGVVNVYNGVDVGVVDVVVVGYGDVVVDIVCVDSICGDGVV